MLFDPICILIPLIDIIFDSLGMLQLDLRTNGQLLRGVGERGIGVSGFYIQNGPFSVF